MISLTSAGLRPSIEKLAGEGGRDDPVSKHDIDILFLPGLLKHN